MEKINEDVIKIALMCIEALETHEVRYDMDEYYYYDETINRLKTLIKEFQKQEKLLELYERLATYRLVVIVALLDEVMDLTDFENTKEFIDYIKYQAKHYGNEDAKIVEEIEKVLNKAPLSEG